jgi:energy-converting hydrogenase Eha subunit A
MSRRNVILFATPVIAVIVVAILLKGLGADREMVLLAQAAIVVVCGGALGAFADPIPGWSWRHGPSEAVRHRRRRK